MKHLRLTVLVLGTMALGLLTWSVLHEPYPPADWLSVEAPGAATLNQRLPLRVTIPSPSVSGFLSADLHWSASRHQPGGFLSSCPAQWVGSEGGVFTFELPVPPQNDLQHVVAVIYLGPTDQWADRWLLAETAELAVRPQDAAVDQTLRRLPAYEQFPDPEVRFHEAPWGRPTIAGLWLLAALFAWRDDPEPALEARPTSPWNRLRRHWLLLACLAAAGFELSGAELHLAAWLRAYAHEHKLYEERRWLQQVATLMALGGTTMIGGLALWRIRSPARSLALLGLGLFAAFAGARLISQHEVDLVLALQMGPLALGQLAKLSAAMLVVVALWPRRNSEQTPGVSHP